MTAARPTVPGHLPRTADGRSQAFASELEGELAPVGIVVPDRDAEAEQADGRRRHLRSVEQGRCQPADLQVIEHRVRLRRAPRDRVKSASLIFRVSVRPRNSARRSRSTSLSAMMSSSVSSASRPRRSTAKVSSTLSDLRRRLGSTVRVVLGHGHPVEIGAGPAEPCDELGL